MRLLLLVLAVVFAALPAAAQYEATLASDIFPRGYRYTLYDGRLFFPGYESQSGIELWAYDAATEEAALAADIEPGSGSSLPGFGPNNRNRLGGFAVYHDRLFFPALTDESGVELWAFDAATSEAALIADIYPGANDSSPHQLVVYEDRLFFSAYHPEVGGELLAYDAATGEVVIAANISLFDFSSRPTSLTVYDGRLFFQADGDQTGRELWSYDAATGEATLAADINPGGQSSSPGDGPDGTSGTAGLVVYDGRLFFPADDVFYGRALRVFDASTGEATLAADIDSGGLVSSPYAFAVYDDRLFFSAYDAQNGFELRAFDAATGETTLAADIVPGWGSSFPRGLTVYDGRLFFQANDYQSGEELWYYDATTGEASLAADINPGSDSSSPANLTVYDDRLFMQAIGEPGGVALWVLSRDSSTSEPTAESLPVHFQTPHPNPAISSTNVTFEMAEAGPVRIEVFDMLGRRVAVLADGTVEAGEHALTWEAGTLPSGLYLVRLTAGNTVQTRRLTLAR